MKDFTVEVKSRDTHGSAAARRARREGLVPSVVYQKGEPAVSGFVNARAFIALAQVARGSQVFNLKSDIKVLNGKSALVKEVQRDFIKNNVLHVDFQALNENEAIVVRVSIKIVGEAPGVKNDGGILTTVSHFVSVSCLPKYIPDEIKVDVSDLAINDSKHARDLVLPEGLKLAGDPDETIVAVVTVRQVVEETTPGAVAAADGATPAAEGAAAAPAAGAAAPAAAGADKKAGDKKAPEKKADKK